MYTLPLSNSPINHKTESLLYIYITCVYICIYTNFKHIIFFSILFIPIFYNIKYYILNTIYIKLRIHLIYLDTFIIFIINTYVSFVLQWKYQLSIKHHFKFQVSISLPSPLKLLLYLPKIPCVILELTSFENISYVIHFQNSYLNRKDTSCLNRTNLARYYQRNLFFKLQIYYLTFKYSKTHTMSIKDIYKNL